MTGVFRAVGERDEHYRRPQPISARATGAEPLHRSNRRRTIDKIIGRGRMSYMMRPVFTMPQDTTAYPASRRPSSVRQTLCTEESLARHPTLLDCQRERRFEGSHRRLGMPRSELFGSKVKFASVPRQRPPDLCPGAEFGLL